MPNISAKPKTKTTASTARTAAGYVDAKTEAFVKYIREAFISYDPIEGKRRLKKMGVAI